LTRWRRRTTSTSTAQCPGYRSIAVSVEAGGRIGRLAVGGSLRTDGDDVITLEDAGTVGELTAGEIVARGVGSDAVRVSGSGSVGGLDAVKVSGPVRRAELCCEQ
jgi:hypothetical protein